MGLWTSICPGGEGKRGGILADPAVMLSRLVRGCIALAFTGSVTPDLSGRHIVDTVKGSKHSYMALALKREPTACSMLAINTCQSVPGRP